MTSRPGKRLTRDDWLSAGAALLATDGAESLKAEPMARHMNATKGSFYWHFKDVPDFHDQVLARWEAAVLAAMGAVLDGEAGDVARLRALAQSIADPAEGGATEAAIRAWATTHAPARAAVGRVDAARLTALQGLLRETGIGNPEMARIIHAAGIGMGLLDNGGTDDGRGAIGSLVDLVLALR